MSDIFISYSRRDKPFVGRLRDELAKREQDVWVDWEDIPVTADWWQEICSGIEAANTFVFVISPDSMSSHICQLEVDHARRFGKRLVPICHREIDEASLFAEVANRDTSLLTQDMLVERDLTALVARNWKALSRHNWLFFREEDDFETAFNQLITAVNADLAHVHEHTRLLLRAKEWQTANRDNNLLLRGTQLEQAQTWLREAGEKSPTPTELHITYIDASRDHEFKVLEDERLRLQRELNRQRLLTRGGTIAGVLIILLLVAAVVFGIQSEERRKTANQNAATATIAQGEALQQASTAVAAQSTSDANALIAQRNAATATIAQGQALNSAATSVANAATATVAQGDALQQASTAVAAQSTSDANALIAQRNAATATVAQGDALYQASTAVAAQSTSEANALIAQHNAATATVAQGDALYQASTAVAAQSTSEANALIAQHNAATATVAQGDALYQASTAVAAQSTSEANALIAQHNAATATVAQGDALYQASTAVAAQSTAVAALQVSEANERLARAQSLGSVADQLLDTGNVDLALALALEAATLNPSLVQAQGVLNRAMDISPVLVVPNSAIARFSSDERYLLTVNNSEYALYLWDIQTRALIHRMQGHIKPILDAQFSPDGRFIVSSSEDTSVVVWDAATGQERYRITAHDTPVTGLAISADSTRLATGASWSYQTQGESPVPLLVIWDLSTGELVGYNNLNYGLSSLSWFSEDNRYLYVVDLVSNGVSVLDLATGKWQFTTSNMAIIPGINPKYGWTNGNFFNGPLLIHDVFSGSVIRQVINGFNWDTDWVDFITASGDNRTLLIGASRTLDEKSGLSEKRLVYFDIATGAVINDYAQNSISQVNDAFIAADNTSVLSVTDDNQVVLWDAPTGNIIRTLGVSDQPLTNLGFSAHERYALMLAADGSARVFDVSARETNEELRITVQGGDVENISYSHDGSRLFATSGAEWVTFDAATGRELERVYLGNFVNDMALDPTKDQALISIAIRQEAAEGRGSLEMLTRDIGGSVMLQELGEHGTLRAWGVAGDYLCNVAYNADGTLALLEGSLWDMHTMQFVRTVEPAIITGLRAGLARDVEAQRMKVQRCECPQTLSDFTNSPPGTCIDIRDELFSPDGRYVATSIWHSVYWQALRETPEGSGQYVIVESDTSQGAAVTLLDVATGQEIHTLTGFQGLPTRLDFSPDGTLLIAAITDPDNALLLWDVSTGELLRRFIGHKDSVNDVVFSPDGLTALSASSDGTLILWDVSTGQPIRHYRGHQGEVQRVVFRPDGKQALSTDGTEIIAWRIDSLDDLVAWVKANRAVTTLTCAQREQYNVRPLCSEITPTPQPTAMPTIVPTPFLRGKIIASAAVNVRAQPAADALVIGTITSGTQVEVMAIEPQWYQIVLPDGQIGWIARQFLERE